jgi:6-phosphogluconolactonase
MIPREPRILVSPDSDSWAAFAADTIGQEIRSVLSRKNVCHVMLTGGKTAERLYRQWAKTAVLPLKNICFYFGDERCVPPDHPDSNYNMVMRTLFEGGMPSGCSIVRMEAENTDREEAVRKYEKLIPEEVDVLLLGMGADGHIASLFPNSSALLAEKRSVLPVTGLQPPHERLTITPTVITHARSVFLIATGKEKGEVLAEALKSPVDFLSLPVRLASGSTYLLDDKAGDQLRGYFMVSGMQKKEDF